MKPFVKRNKNDAVDAEAICEAAPRPSMRFVAVKTQEQQAAGLVFRTRDLVVGESLRTNSLLWQPIVLNSHSLPQGGGDFSK